MFLGIGLLFVAMLFVQVVIARGLFDTITGVASVPKDQEFYRFARGMACGLMNTFGIKMAAVFMFVTSTIGIRTRVLARWVSVVGFASGLVLLLAVTDFPWIGLIFPAWVIVVSLYILATGRKD